MKMNGAIIQEEAWEVVQKVDTT